MTKQMACRNRMLKKTESFGDYFQSRRALQRYVYPHGTSDKVLIRDIMEGIPQHLHPIIRANSIGVRNIEEFRRVLIDLEPGIRDYRAYTPHVPRSANTHKGAVNNIQAPSNKGSDKSTRSPPKTPCRCGQLHWYADCPLKKKTASVNFASKKEPATFPNNVPLGKNTKWRPREEKTEERFKEVNVATRSTHNAGEPATLRSGVLSAQEPPAPAPAIYHSGQADICPTFAIAKIGSEDGMLHKVCIDTGSSISCIDYDYAKKHLPGHEIKPTSNFRLLGVGTNMTTGTLQASLHLVTSDPNVYYRREVTLHVVPRLNTKVIIGNDQLVPMQANIDLRENLMTFKNNNKQVVIASTRASSENSKGGQLGPRRSFRSIQDTKPGSLSYWTIFLRKSCITSNPLSPSRTFMWPAPSH
jgi:hypothetical protein